MLILASTSDKLQVVTSAAVAVDVQASYVDRDPTAASATELAPKFLPGRKNTAITTATTTDVTGSPGASIQRTIRELSHRNKSATTSVTLTVQHTDGTTTVDLIKVTLLPGYILLFRDGMWVTYDTNGAVQSAGGTAVDPTTNDFRLSGVSATPVMTADNAALATVFLCQYKGNNVALNDSVQWQLVSPASEVSLAVTGRTTDLPFDVFAFLSGGTVALEFLNWTSATARAVGLTRVDGTWTKTGDVTRRYLGSIRARSATTYGWVTQGSQASVKLDLFNVDNRVDFGFKNTTTAATWAYTTATIRQAQASALFQIEVMVGLAENFIDMDLNVSSANSTISIGRAVGIGYDSTTTFTGTNGGTINTVASIQSSQFAQLTHQPAIGRHLYSWNETSVATGTCTWTGVGVVAGFNQQSGMSGTWTC